MLTYRIRSPFSFLALGFALMLAGLVAGQERGQRNEFQKDDPRVRAAFRLVVDKPSQSVVRITCNGEEAALGVVVGAEGWVLTKTSQLQGKPLCRFKDGREREGRVIGVDDKYDLALLKVEAQDLKPVAWAASKTEAVGNWVASPGLGELPLAIGVISVATRDVPRPRRPVPNSAGGYLGVALEEEEKAARITEVLPNTGAARAGLKTDDVILTINGKALEGLDKFMETLGEHKPGDIVKLRIRRGDEELQIEAKLGKRPVNRGDFQNALGGELSRRRSGFPTILQHDSVLKPTDCGGPLVDLDGKVIGINIARAGRTESYAVPAEVIQALLPELMSGKRAPLKKPAQGR